MLDHECSGGHQRAPALGHQRQYRFQLGFATECTGYLQGCVQRIHGPAELGVLSLQTRVSPRVVDRHTGEVGQELHGLLILVGELRFAGLLGKVEVPIRAPADEHGNPQKRPHRRVPGGEAIGLRMRADILQT